MALINPSLVAAATTPPNAASAQAVRKTNAAAYQAVMREVDGQSAPRKTEAKAVAAGTADPQFAREAPFGADRPRYQRPGALLDIIV